jgi:hypothetical protein
MPVYPAREIADNFSRKSPAIDTVAIDVLSAACLVCIMSPPRQIETSYNGNIRKTGFRAPS